jgi:hypothetical protein
MAAKAETHRKFLNYWFQACREEKEYRIKHALSDTADKAVGEHWVTLPTPVYLILDPLNVPTPPRPTGKGERIMLTPETAKALKDAGLIWRPKPREDPYSQIMFGEAKI